MNLDRLDHLVEEGLGQVFLDYNACLTERKPDRDAPRSGR